MPSAVALRAVLAASLGLGVVDVVWINVALLPEVSDVTTPSTTSPVVTAVAAAVATPNAAAVATPQARPAAAAAPTPGPTVDPEVAPRIVYFGTRSASLDDAALVTLRDLVAELPADAELVLEGHADHRGAEWLNRRLSKDRAHAVANQLAELGVPRTQMRIRYVGEAYATHVGADAEVWRDRRVDIEIHSGGTP